MNVQAVVPFLWVHDIQRSHRFYVEGLGFAVKHQWIDDGKLRWSWLTLGDAALMLQEFWTEGPHRNLPAGPVGTGVSLCFTCRDAVAIYHEVRGRGLDPKTPFVGNAMWVTELRDPDGYHILFESPTDVPEETVYSSTQRS